MRISVAHEAHYRYDMPSTGVIQMLRLTPRNHTGQYVVDWRIEISADCRLEPQEDAFGNIVHAFSTDGPLAELHILAEGEVETQDTAGVVRGAVERFTPSLFLRETPLTRADEAMAAFAAQIRGAPPGEPGSDNTLAVLHRLLTRLDDDFTCDAAFERPETTAASAFAAKRGSCRDLAHVFITAARALGVPARFVSGYLCYPSDAGDQASLGNSRNTGSAGDATSPLARDKNGRGDEPDGEEALAGERVILVDVPDGAGDAGDGLACGPGHAWAEAHVAGLGWVGFDPANRICVTDRYVRVAIGLDRLGAAPVRGAHFGGGREAVAYRLMVSQAGWQAQG